jgi:hypothetical protein
VEIVRITVQGQPDKNVSETSSQQAKPDRVVHIYNPSYMGDIGRRSMV